MRKEPKFSKGDSIRSTSTGEIYRVLFVDLRQQCYWLGGHGWTLSGFRYVDEYYELFSDNKSF